MHLLAPNGHVHTYEYNHSRVEAARDQFKKMDLTDIISVYHAGIITIENKSCNHDLSYERLFFLPAKLRMQTCAGGRTMKVDLGRCQNTLLMQCF